MSCAALGSLCEKFALSLRCGKCCNWSFGGTTTTTVVFNANKEPEETTQIVQKAIKEIPANLNLRDAFNSLTPKKVSLLKDEKEKEVAEETETINEDQQDVLLGVYRYAHQLYPEDPNEGFCRFSFAAKVIDCDVAELYNTKENTITQKKQKELLKLVGKVHKVGSDAALIWEVMKNNKIENLQQLQQIQQLKIITEGQFKILRDLFSKESDFIKITSAESFNSLDDKTKKIFIKTAEKYPAKCLQEQKQIPWEKSKSQIIELTKEPSDLSEEDILINKILKETNDVTEFLLKQNAGIIYFLFESLKSSFDENELKSKYEFSNELLSELKNLNKKSNNFYHDIGSAIYIYTLPPSSILLLYTLCSKFPLEIIHQKNKQFSFEKWFLKKDISIEKPLEEESLGENSKKDSALDGKKDNDTDEIMELAKKDRHNTTPLSNADMVVTV
jgi:hypothetical protein